MREITRIHIAKVAYDIEVDAKKEIETYVSALERYANDPEILVDIEIRITELLAERGVMAGGVITANDVTAVRTQLGEPSEFASEGVEAAPVQEAGEGARRVYRDTDNALVGGVLAGFGKFFGVDPLWVRLVFIVVLFASFGTALIVYLTLWLIVPPATTAAEKLRMSGRPVTLAAIKELVGNEEQRSERGKTARRLLSFGTGTLLILLAIGGLLAIVAVLSSLVFGYEAGQSPLAISYLQESWWIAVALGLFVLSGLLFSALCFILASAAFRRQWTKRIGTAAVAIIAAGLVSFASGIGVGIYGHGTEQVQNQNIVSGSSLPSTFSSVKKVVVVSDPSITGFDHVHFQYEVSDRPRLELHAPSTVEEFYEISEDGQTATFRLVSSEINQSSDVWGGSMRRTRSTLTVYGPALDSIVLEDENNKSLSYRSGTPQAELSVSVGFNTEFSLTGDYDVVRVTSGLASSVELGSASIGELQVDNKAGTVIAGVVRTLDVRQPDVCAVHESDNPNHYVKVKGVSSGRLIYNGTEQPAKSISSSCGKVVIGDEIDEEREL